MKEEKDQIKPVSDKIYKNENSKLVVGSISSCIDYGKVGVEYINYYIDGKPYKCYLQDFDRMLTSFLNDNNEKELLWKED